MYDRCIEVCSSIGSMRPSPQFGFGSCCLRASKASEASRSSPASSAARACGRCGPATIRSSDLSPTLRRDIEERIEKQYRIARRQAEFDLNASKERAEQARDKLGVNSTGVQGKDFGGLVVPKSSPATTTTV